MAFLYGPALIPLGMSIGKIIRNSTADERDSNPLTAHATRSQGVVDRLTAGGASAPITHWSEQHLERMIRRNSVFRDHADELRLAHAAGSVSASSSRTSTAESLPTM